MASATATDVNGDSVTDYAVQTIQLRYASLFNFSIFYNVTMEFAPSPKMDIYGPVYSNQATYLTENGNTLTFHNTFNTASTFSSYPIDGAASGRPMGHQVFFPDLNGNEVSILNPIINGTNLATWADSFLNAKDSGGAAASPNQSAALPNETWAQAASALWGGDVNTSAQVLTVPGVPAVGAQIIIQPPDPTLSPVNSASNYSAAEADKFANQAGFYIVVTPNNNGDAFGATVVGFYGTPGQVQTNALNYLYSNFAARTKNTAAQRTAWLTANASKVIFSNGALADGTKSTIANPAAGKDGANTLIGIVNVDRLMYDPREQKLLNTVDIDVGALRAAVGTGGGTATTTATTLMTGSNSGSLWDIDGTSGNQGQWNGVVYVDVETDTTAGAGWQSTSDIKSGGTAITGTGTETAVRLEDGANLPARYAGSNAQDYGFSLATNAPVYVVGNYNSDGAMAGGANPTTTNVMAPDSTASPTPSYAQHSATVNEVPAMVAGDAIDILSKGWWNSPDLTNYPNDPNGYPGGDGVITTSAGAYSAMPTAGSTEVSAGFIAGNVPTVVAGGYNYSGGVENYMRFDEDWSAATIRYRGSIVGLYNSQVATGAWKGGVYNPPVRQWGYDNMFGTAHQYPPGSPSVLDLRRFNYTDISLAQFNAFMINTAQYNFQPM
jgi:hypothetical protein